MALVGRSKHVSVVGCWLSSFGVQVPVELKISSPGPVCERVERCL